MSLLETLDTVTGTIQARETRHELFELCMSRVEAGELTMNDLPAELSRLSRFCEGDRLQRTGRAVLSDAGVQPDQQTIPYVTVALDERLV